MLTWPAKDPDEVLDYTWEPPLDTGDTIAGHTATVGSGTVTIDSSSKTDSAVTVWLSGGVAGETSALTLRVTTAGGRVFEATALLAIVASDGGFATSFQAAFPAFSAVAVEAISYWKARAERVIDDSFGDDQAHATMLLTAHYLATNGLGSDVDSQRSAKFGGASRVKSGTLELSWADGKKTTGTRYGDQALALILTYRGGPAVAGTGTWPAGYGFNGFAGPLPPYGG